MSLKLSWRLKNNLRSTETLHSALHHPHHLHHELINRMKCNILSLCHPFCRLPRLLLAFVDENAVQVSQSSFCASLPRLCCCCHYAAVVVHPSSSVFLRVQSCLSLHPRRPDSGLFLSVFLIHCLLPVFL